MLMVKIIDARYGGKRDILFYLDKQGRNSGMEMVRRQPTCE